MQVLVSVTSVLRRAMFPLNDTFKHFPQVMRVDTVPYSALLNTFCVELMRKWTHIFWV